MKTFTRPGALLALCLLAIPAAQAAYNPGIVASDARWVVYADLNSLRESTLGKELIGAISQAQSQATGGAIGLDIPKLLTTVGSITAYGTNLTPDPAALDGALIAEGTADLRKIAESLLLQGTIAQAEIFSEVTDLPFPAYAIADPNSRGDQKMQLIVAFPPEPIVLVSKSKAQLIKAREVFQGKAPSLVKGNAALAKLAGVSQGAYLFASTVVPNDLGFAEKSPQTRVLQLTNSGALALGERGSNTFAHAELIASSDANAEKLTKILQGLTAVLSMAETNDNALSDFLKSTSVTQDKDRVTLRLAYSSERLVQMTQNLHSQIEAKPRPRPAQPITIGTSLSEWGGESSSAASSAVADANGVIWQTIENVKLNNGSLITVGRSTNGAKTAKFDRVEIVGAAVNASPLVFKQEYMRGVGGRGNMWQFAFPAADGTYTLRVGYINIPADSKAKFAVSISEPNAPAAPAAPSKAKSR